MYRTHTLLPAILWAITASIWAFANHTEYHWVVAGVSALAGLFHFIGWIGRDRKRYGTY